MKIKVPNRIKELAERTGIPIYVVGGYPRNALLFGKIQTDYDICGPLTVEELTKLLEGYAKVIPVNPRIGTVLICYKGDKYEYTTFRRDSYPIGGAHTPEAVEFVRSVEEDALRRDFRVNALYVNALTEELIDPLGGLDDIEERVLVTANGRKTFDEDGLRLLRLVRFACELGFTVSDEAMTYSRELAFLLRDISVERKTIELKKILLSDLKNNIANAPVFGIKLILSIGLDKYISAELSATLRDMTEEELRGITEVNGLDRVAYIGYFLAKRYGFESISSVFGQRGLKCSNDFIKEIRSLVEYLLFIGNDEEKRIFIQSRFSYAKRGDELCKALGFISDYYLTYQEMLNNGVTFNSKELNYSGLVLKRMGIKPDNRCKLLHRLLEESAKKNKKLTEKEEREIVDLYL